MRCCAVRVTQPELYDARQERFIALFSTSPEPFPVQFGRQWFAMGRTKNFSPEGVLEKALPVFWKYGFADTSLRERRGRVSPRHRAAMRAGRLGRPYPSPGSESPLRMTAFQQPKAGNSTGTEALQSRDSTPTAAVVPTFLLRSK